MDINKWKREWVSLSTEDQRNDFEIRFRNAISLLSEKEKLRARSEFLQLAREDMLIAKEIAAEGRRQVIQSI